MTPSKRILLEGGSGEAEGVVMNSILMWGMLGELVYPLSPCFCVCNLEIKKLTKDLEDSYMNKWYWKIWIVCKTWRIGGEPELAYGLPEQAFIG